MIDKTIIDRRHLLQMGVGFGLAPAMIGSAVTTPSHASTTNLNLTTAEDRFKAHIKLVGSLDDEEVYTYFSGTLWGILPNSEPQAICAIYGLGKSLWIIQEDGSMKEQVFDIGYFSALGSDLPADEFLNPLNGETVRPFHYRYGGNEVHHKPSDSLYTDKGDSDWINFGPNVLFTSSGSGNYNPPLSKEEWPRETVGDKFYVGSEVNYIGSTEQLADQTIKSADKTLFWTGIVSWEPWLLMNGVPGFAMWRTTGYKLKKEDVPQAMKDHLAKVEPTYFEAGRVWDGRVTTTTEYKEKRTPAS